MLHFHPTTDDAALRVRAIFWRWYFAAVLLAIMTGVTWGLA